MKSYSDQIKNTRSTANANQSFYSRENEGGAEYSSNTQVATLQPPALFSSNSVIQKQSNKQEGNSISLEDAKRIILKATKGMGTDESAIYSAIRKCSNHKGLMYDSAVINALNGDMDGHELWKSYLLIEYGNESNYPSSIHQLWNATKGMGTDEAAVFTALDGMDQRAKNSFGLKYILRSELSGDDLQKALDLITTSDSIADNAFGGQEEGKEELIVTEDNLRQLIDSRFVGASSAGLKSAMDILYSKPGGTLLSETLTRVETIRGMAPGSALAQYNKALKKQIEGVDHYKKHKEDKGQVYDHAVDNPSPALSSDNKDFTASSAQLRFGKILGDVFGIDAVFGSLISPTGGMAGPGNERIPIVKDGGAVATHGAIHDAAGYLYNCHGIGPGYDYLKSEAGSDPSNPLAGQTNMNWWIQEYDRTDNEVQWFERFLNSKAHIGAAFSKKYKELNTPQKKEALKVMSETSSFMLSQGGISNTDRINKINELMDSCNAGEKTELADYFYNNDGFSTVSGVFAIMKPFVSPDAYDYYQKRQMLYGSAMAF